MEPAAAHRGVRDELLGVPLHVERPVIGVLPGGMVTAQKPRAADSIDSQRRELERAFLIRDDVKLAGVYEEA